jgi:adenylate kinase family enzyme
MKIAVSGTYSSGKTTFSYALSYLTGMPRTNAKAVREIIVDAFPGKMLEECSWDELFTLCLLRFSNRIICEAKLGDNYISDGSALHEWVYAEGRFLYGKAPKEKTMSLWEKLSNYSQMKIFKNSVKCLGRVIKIHAKEEYDAYIHLPTEAPITADWHRPMSEGFRAYTNNLLYTHEKELPLPLIEVSGSLEERLEQAVEKLGLSTQMEISEAVLLTTEAMNQKKAALEELHRRAVETTVLQ